MDVSIFLGALFGFLAGLVIQWLITWWRRHEQGTLYRNLIAVELLHNLEAMWDMLESAERTKQGAFSVAETPIARPRAEVLRSIANASDALLSLTQGERYAIVQLVAHLDRALAEYSSWPEAIGGQRGLIQLQLPDGTKRLAREVATEQLRATLRTVMTNQVGMLVTVINESSEKNLTPHRPLQAIWRALEPTRKGWRKDKAIQAAVTAPDVGELADQGNSRPLVVWSRGSSNYDRPFIELKSLAEDRVLHG